MSNLYIANHMAYEYGPFSGDKFYTSNDVDVNSICYVISGNMVKPSPLVSYQLEGKYLVDRVTSASDDPASLGKKYELSLKPLGIPKDYTNLEKLSGFDKKLFQNNFSGFGVKKIPKSQEYLIKLLDNALSDAEETYASEILEDLAAIEVDEEADGPTDKLELKKARIGQGKFRKNTIEIWGGDERCAVTGLKITSLLNASHIKPWRECNSKSEKLSGSNGMLLCVHLDRLFDRFLIGFQKTSNPNIRNLVCSPKLKDKFRLLAVIGITSSLKLDLSMVKFAGITELERNLDAHLARVLKIK